MTIFNSAEYGLIYADPPWRQRKGGIRKVRPNQTRSLDYRTLSLSDISQIIRSIPTPTDSTLFLWTIDKYLHDAEKLFSDYRLHARIVWDKENGVAPAFSIRYSHEYLLWLYKGQFIPVNQSARGKYCSVIRERATIHSRKPESAYRMIEDLYPNTPRVELFARNYRTGWDSMGDQLPINKEG